MEIDNFDDYKRAWSEVLSWKKKKKKRKWKSYIATTS
jgi:hypothetical protein